MGRFSEMKWTGLGLAAACIGLAAMPARAFTFDSHTNQSGAAAALRESSTDDGMQIGGGHMHFSITGAGSGTRGGASPFLPSRDSKFYSPYDADAHSGFSPYDQR